MRTVAALCVGPNSVYKTLPGVEAYDMKRDARTFPGGMPVVAHPPCRSWSAYCAHQAKPAPGEKELGLFCVEQVKRWGGVVEQPAFSRLWDAAGLPKPGMTHRRDFFSLEVWQYWWGYPVRKRTWLFFSGVNCDELVFPLRLHPKHDDERRKFAVMSKHQRSHTNEPFAQWLVDAARMSRVSLEIAA